MRKQSRFNTIFMATLFGGATLLACSVASAAITEQCSYCHTMHNSQDGGAFSSPRDPGGRAASTLNGALLRWDCAGCHSGYNTVASIAGGTGIPKVNSTTDGAPTYVYGPSAGADNDTLAGGDFYWVADAGGNDDTTGHNVDIVAGADAMGLTPPGWDNGMGTGVNGGAATWSVQLKCAGTNGCHGDHSEGDAFAAISGAHHGDDGTTVGTSVATSYRWLSGATTGAGILGKEDVDWEFSRLDNSTNHNQYKGEDRPKTAAGDAISSTQTISYLCAKCHGQFHNDNSATGTPGITNADDAWMRHPSDYDMANTASGSEYKAYPGAGGTEAARPYSTAAPVASVDVSAALATVSLNPATDTAIVTCISCHRAHGSPYADLVRWDYMTNCFAGGSSGDSSLCGCFNCHTTKD
jgi:hypothetical protein